jgi:hypothetical protein
LKTGGVHVKQPKMNRLSRMSDLGIYALASHKDAKHDEPLFPYP